MTVIEFVPEHLERIRVKECQSGEVPTTVMTYALSLMDGDRPVAIFGGFLFVPGVIHFWGLVSEDVKKKPLAFHKLVRHLLDYYEKKEKPRRMQIDVKSTFKEGKRWAESLGFSREGTMKRYGACGEDFDLYARTF